MIENVKVMEYHVLHCVDLFDAFARRKPWMCGSNDPESLCECLMETEPQVFAISRMQVKKDFALAAFHDLCLAARYFDQTGVLLAPGQDFKCVLEIFQLV